MTSTETRRAKICTAVLIGIFCFGDYVANGIASMVPEREPVCVSMGVCRFTEGR